MISRRDALRSLAAGSAAGALGAGAVLVAAPVEASTAPACPMLELVERIEAVRAEREAIQDSDAYDDFHERYALPLEHQFVRDPPAVTSVAGAAAALRLTMYYECLDEEDERPIRRALDFLEGRA